MCRVLIPPELSPALRVHGPPGGPLQHFAGVTMGTTWAVKLAGPLILPASTLRADLQQLLDTVVAQMSSWEPQSTLSRFNRAPHLSWHDLPEEFFTVLSYSLGLACTTDGAFDPTVGSLTNLWGFGPHTRRTEPPQPDEIAAARSRSGWRRIALDMEHRRARQGEVELDLSGVAKGFAVDQLAGCLTDLGIDHYLVEVGGELRGRGCKPDGSPWWVAIEPAGPGHRSPLKQTRAALHDMAVATSGDYRRYFEHRGRRYQHTLDPRNGYPVETGTAAVTVFHPTCMQADALATALTVLGPGPGSEYARRHKIAALFTLRTPAGLEELLTPTLADFLAIEE